MEAPAAAATDGGGGEHTHKRRGGRASALLRYTTHSQRGERVGGAWMERETGFFSCPCAAKCGEREKEREQQPRLDRPTKSSRRTTTASPSLTLWSLRAWRPLSSPCCLSCSCARRRRGGGEWNVRARVRGEKLVAEGTSSFSSSYQVERSSLSSQRN